MRYRHHAAAMVVLVVVLVLSAQMLFAQSAPRTYLPLIGNQIEVVRNGGFEVGPSAWEQFSRKGYPIITQLAAMPKRARSGTGFAWLGRDNDEIASLWQTIDLPNNTLVLRYWVRIESPDTNCSGAADIAGVLLDFAPDDLLVTLDAFPLCVSTATNGYVERLVDLTPYHGRRATLEFVGYTNESNPSSLLIDDIMIEASSSFNAEAAAPVEPYRQLLLERRHQFQAPTANPAPAR
ncbi:hypothetical protein [Kallotenue papyrolyticum]|uniref:hypothetical protein n=1 Tax=Kallotenue papyrolyticum TaxID=1325125 RepID=UPI000492DBEC|nr:hypothetical protein [Kallotenue papyrolyticum]